MIPKLKNTYKRKISFMNSALTPIVLIGFMGTGKTTLGQYMAKANNYTYIDLDHYIVEQEQRTIPEIFESDGESVFRQLEAFYLQQCLEQYDIIATGGGIIEGEQSLQLLKQVKYVYWLDCELEVLYERVKSDENRPNANNKTFPELKWLYLSRVSRYNEIAFKKVNSNQKLCDLQSEIIQSLISD